MSFQARHISAVPSHSVNPDAKATQFNSNAKDASKVVCTLRKTQCVYANEPLSSPNALTSPSAAIDVRRTSSTSPTTLQVTVGANTFDPFDSYPPTSLPRARVQNLIGHFLSKIAFQYYPLDLDPTSNPFINSWWPLALADPALFNVSLQTASLDVELHAQKGFHQSAILMHDAVSLIRHKIDDPTLAFQDATLDAVVTLAAIEHGKGNIHECKMHIDAVKRMVAVRGGLSEVKRSSPLTARMVPWVSLLVTGSPQFEVQDDYGNGNGIAPIDQWQLAPRSENHNIDLEDSPKFGGLNPNLEDVFVRLRNILNPAAGDESPKQLSTNDLHDLTCFVLHKLLSPSLTELDAISECVRHATAIYMFVIHGPTYYSHAAILHQITFKLQTHLEELTPSHKTNSSLHIWCVSVGMLAATGTGQQEWFISQGSTIARTLGMETWEGVKSCLQDIFALDVRSEVMFRKVWEPILASSPASTGPTDARALYSPFDNTEGTDD
ncbi:hypothetical protein VTL71DRAFT_4355 [Oculimacula yallundae]|uniref:Uncharacterized protein n=1 Tax=Oculimacula yallundae TaxID=86028 RepID=A0ABR4C2Y2_9HELO